MDRQDGSSSPPLTQTSIRTEKDGMVDDQPKEPLFLSAEERYGYYPAASYDQKVGNSQYIIVRKLGWARSSTVFLCSDTSASYSRYVAIKILSIHATGCIVGGLSHEFTVFKRINSIKTRYPGLSYCSIMLSAFLAKSSTGSHICFVMDILGSSLMNLSLQQPNERFTLPVAKSVIQQILMAIDYLNRECGYVHTDIKLDNILVAQPKFIAPSISKYLQSQQSAIRDGDPFQVTKSQPLPDFDLDLSRIHVRLIDYTRPTDKFEHSIHYQAPIVRAPEVTLGHPFSTSVDIWSIGSLFFELVRNYHLFKRPGEYSDAVHLQSIAETLGPFPERFLKNCSRRNDFFDERGSLVRVVNFSPRSLEQIFYDLGAIEAGGVPDLAAFLKRCLTLDPSSRPTAFELMSDGWLMND